MALKLFLSHANADLYLAQALKLRLEELSDEIHCFLFADDVFVGGDWDARLREAAEECDGIVSVVSVHYVDRPWFIAEWAAFWLQEKNWYPLLYKVRLDKLFEPMRRRQAFSLTDRFEIERFLLSLSVQLSNRRPLDLVSAELVKAIEGAAQKHAAEVTETMLDRLARSLTGEAPKVGRDTVEAICRAGQAPRMLELVAKADNSVALRQLGVILVQLNEIDTARVVADRIPNLAERRTVGLRVLDLLVRGPENEEALELVAHIYRSVRDPQRRDLRNGATERELNIDWPELPPNP